jgi:hypothetical protein
MLHPKDALPRRLRLQPDLPWELPVEIVRQGCRLPGDGRRAFFRNGASAAGGSSSDRDHACCIRSPSATGVAAAIHVVIAADMELGDKRDHDVQLARCSHRHGQRADLTPGPVCTLRPRVQPGAGGQNADTG